MPIIKLNNNPYTKAPPHPGVNNKEMKAKELCECFSHFIPLVQWMVTEDGTRLMPHIKDGDNRWRINYCPSCGKEVRSIELTEEEFLSITTSK